MPVFVSYFTDQFYLKEAFDLARSLQAFNLDYDIREVPNTGSWEGNTNHKPAFLIKMAREYPDQAIVWLDADARVRKMPGLFAEGCINATIAYHCFKRPGGAPGALSGTVYLAAGDERMTILKEWAAEVIRSPNDTDQRCMETAVRRIGAKWVELPEAYCWIYDLAQGLHQAPDPAKARPVIEHLQASRWRKRMRVVE